MINIEGVESNREAQENKDRAEARQEIIREIEKTGLGPEETGQAAKQADDIKDETEQEQIQRLLELAEARGLVFAVETARKMNNHLLLDKFHDALVEDRIFRKYLNK